MNLSVQKWGAFLAVLLSGVGLARHATSSSSGDPIVSTDPTISLDQQARLIESAAATLVATAPESVSIPSPTLPANPIASTTRITAQTLATLPLAMSTEEQPLSSLVIDRPPKTLDSDSYLNLPEEAKIEEQSLSEAAAQQELAPDLKEKETEENDDPQEPAPITEPEARATVLNMLGGKAAYYSGESDMAHAYAAAKKALRQQGIRLSGVKSLAIIDFTLPSFDRRMAIYNPRTGEESRHLVAHGHHSGELYLKSYSNMPRSLQSSPGLYRIGSHYNGEHGRSVRMHGLQKDVNDLAYKRSIVLHSAWYVSYKTILENQVELGVPRIGRSHGCPAVSAEDLPEVLQKLQPGAYLFIYPVPAYVPSPPPEVPHTEGLLR